MAATLSMEVLQDDIAITLAQVIAAANKRAISAGVDVNNSIITIMQIIGKAFLLAAKACFVVGLVCCRSSASPTRFAPDATGRAA
jgi:hypothetical protein